MSQYFKGSKLQYSVMYEKVNMLSVGRARDKNWDTQNMKRSISLSEVNKCNLYRIKGSKKKIQGDDCKSEAAESADRVEG